MLAVFAIMLQIAIDAERFTSGLGKLFATHATIIWYAETAPILQLSVGELGRRGWYVRHQEHGKEPWSRLARPRRNSISHNRNQHQNNNMNTAISRSPRSVRDDERNN
jgi:hypothetical protein